MNSRNATSRQQPVECWLPVIVLLKLVSNQLCFIKDDNENKRCIVSSLKEKNTLYTAVVAWTKQNIENSVDYLSCSLLQAPPTFPAYDYSFIPVM